MTRIPFLLCIVLFLPIIGNTQNLFNGKLIDKTTSELIEGANIVIVGTANGTTSNSDGIFQLDAKKKKVSIVISHLTYKMLTTEISSKTELNTIELERATYQLDEVNIGLGEYNGPTELIEFDSAQYQIVQQERIKRYSSDELVIVEDQAEFYGGKGNLKAFIASSFNYPQEALSQNLAGRAYTMFTISKNGRPKDIEVKILGDDFNDVVKNEMIRMINSMPNWHSAYQRGKAVSVRMVIPILYAVNGYGKKY